MGFISLASLVVIGGVVLVNVGDRHEGLDTAARATLENVRRTRERYFTDMDEWPEYVGDLLQRPPGVQEYEPPPEVGSNGARYLPDRSAGFSADYARDPPQVADAA